MLLSEMRRVTEWSFPKRCRSPEVRVGANKILLQDCRRGNLIVYTEEGKRLTSIRLKDHISHYTFRSEGRRWDALLRDSYPTEIVVLIPRRARRAITFSTLYYIGFTSKTPQGKLLRKVHISASLGEEFRLRENPSSKRLYIVTNGRIIYLTEDLSKSDGKRFSNDVYITADRKVTHFDEDAPASDRKAAELEKLPEKRIAVDEKSDPASKDPLEGDKKESSLVREKRIDDALFLPDGSYISVTGYSWSMSFPGSLRKQSVAQRVSDDVVLWRHKVEGCDWPKISLDLGKMVSVFYERSSGYSLLQVMNLDGETISFREGESSSSARDISLFGLGKAVVLSSDKLRTIDLLE